MHERDNEGVVLTDEEGKDDRDRRKEGYKEEMSKTRDEREIALERRDNNC
jgi:hypothetical protein